MLIKEHHLFYTKLRPYCTGKMLMLGRQDSEIGDAQTVFGSTEYKTLDLDNGDYNVDLQDDLSHMDQQWDTVFNLGTIEHVWDAHKAYSNAARMVKVGGYFIGHAPVENYNNHGIHVTNADAILSFFKLNGFEIVETWKSDSTLLWHVARKISHQTLFTPPQQVFTWGKDDGIKQ